MAKIAVLGCGWLGMPLAEHLVELGYEVNGSTTSLAKLNLLETISVKPYYIDLENDKTEYLDLFLDNVDILIITIPPRMNEEHPTYSTNFEKLMPHLQRNNVNKVIMMSSVSVYAPNKEIVTEETQQYSHEKTAQQILDAERVLLSNSFVNACILRLGGLFGPDRKPVHYICKKAFLDNPELPVNMIHLADIISFTTAIIQNGFQSDCIYNIVSPKYKSRLDYYTQQANENNLDLPPLGINDWEMARKVSGNKIAVYTGKDYQY